MTTLPWRFVGASSFKLIMLVLDSLSCKISTQTLDANRCNQRTFTSLWDLTNAQGIKHQLQCSMLSIRDTGVTRTATACSSCADIKLVNNVSSDSSMMQTKPPVGQEVQLHKPRRKVRACVIHITCDDHINYQAKCDYQSINSSIPIAIG